MAKKTEKPTYKKIGGNGGVLDILHHLILPTLALGPIAEHLSMGF